MKNPQIDKIQNKKIRELANKHVHRSTGDFGMVIEGGVDLEAFAKDIIKTCEAVVAKNYDPCEPWMEPTDLSKHFGGK